ncbi:hypothetical protein BA195_10140 [Tenacibaculum soleae]|uniref:Uncharacterized protein n=1 Tax=Tenacibaculum soleae TaxID=447689 RepID=A0A1B9XYE9_9FLAO|nr:hypothetical protein [Tenacibaculum soleae]OCK42526.1 hypothetical protein BA195_10140 [Tenacibaculum soleae]
MACNNNKLKEGILFDCADTPIKGLSGQRGVIINYSDIDKAGSTVNGATITDLVTTASGISIEWYKELASVASSYASNSEDVDGFSHSFLSRLSTTSAENAERANELKNGRFIVIVETEYKGANGTDGFKAYGWDAGLELSEMSQGSNENSGSMLFTLSTREGTVEQYPYNVFLESDYSTSKATFDALFANV